MFIATEDENSRQRIYIQVAMSKNVCESRLFIASFINWIDLEALLIVWRLCVLNTYTTLRKDLYEKLSEETVSWKKNSKTKIVCSSEKMDRKLLEQLKIVSLSEKRTASYLSNKIVSSSEKMDRKLPKYFKIVTLSETMDRGPNELSAFFQVSWSTTS